MKKNRQASLQRQREMVAREYAYWVMLKELARDHHFTGFVYVYDMYLKEQIDQAHGFVSEEREAMALFFQHLASSKEMDKPSKEEKQEIKRQIEMHRQLRLAELSSGKEMRES